MPALVFLGIVLAVIFGTLLILQAAFGSWRLAAFLLLLVPFALSGGALGLLVSGGTISLGLVAGFFLVLAIAIRQSISLVSRYQQLELSVGQAAGLGLILQGGQERLGPVMTTVVATAVAFLPILLLGDIAGLEVLRPMAAVVIGGLITSTISTLLLAPNVYMRSGPSVQQETMGELLAEGPGLSPV